MENDRQNLEDFLAINPNRNREQRSSHQDKFAVGALAAGQRLLSPALAKALRFARCPEYHLAYLDIRFLEREQLELLTTGVPVTPGGLVQTWEPMGPPFRSFFE